MRSITRLYFVDSQPQFGEFLQAEESSWQLWFAEDRDDNHQPLVVEYNFPVKPTKRQLRKLRRAFRKEASQYKY